MAGAVVTVQALPLRFVMSAAKPLRHVGAVASIDRAQPQWLGSLHRIVAGAASKDGSILGRRGWESGSAVNAEWLFRLVRPGKALVTLRMRAANARAASRAWLPGDQEFRRVALAAAAGECATRFHPVAARARIVLHPLRGVAAIGRQGAASRFIPRGILAQKVGTIQ